MVDPWVTVYLIQKLYATEESKRITYSFDPFGFTVGFDTDKLEEAKPKIAECLYSIGLTPEMGVVSLRDLTNLKDGGVWNKLGNMYDIEALYSILNASAACGFILNGTPNVQDNFNRLGPLNSFYAAECGRATFSTEASWLKYMSDKVLGKMMFQVSSEKLMEFEPTVATIG